MKYFSFFLPLLLLFVFGCVGPFPAPQSVPEPGVKVPYQFSRDVVKNGVIDQEKAYREMEQQDNDYAFWSAAQAMEAENRLWWNSPPGLSAIKAFYLIHFKKVEID